MITCPCQDLFPYNNDAMQEKSNTEGNEKDDKLNEIKSDTRPQKENNTCRQDETIINGTELVIHY